MKLIDGSHFGAELSELERKKIRLWIESSATYPGTYASLGSGMYPVNLPIKRMLGRCGSCHDPKQKKGRAAIGFSLHSLQSMCNLSRPEKSLVLRAPLSEAAGGLGLCGDKGFASTDDAVYQAMLSAINESATQLETQKRFDMPGYRPNKHYIREMKRFGILPADLAPDDPIDVYETDERYWRSFWYVGQGKQLLDQARDTQ
jgi:hypothetical protein